MSENRIMPAASGEVDVEDLKRRLEYRDGKLYRIVPSGPSRRGDVAGWVHSTGHVRVSVGGRQLYAHKIVFALHHGRWPGEIDHIDGNPSNNTIENLREVSRSQNKMNTNLQSNNSSGHKGVSWDAARQKWAAYCEAHGRTVLRRRYDRLEDAVQAVTEARRIAHAEFARHG